MSEKIILKSLRTGESYEATMYQSDDGELVIKHASLNRIFWSMPDDVRPAKTIVPLDLRRLPCIPPMFAVVCRLSILGCTYEEIGEFMVTEWEKSSEIKQMNPLTIAGNRAFDRAFIRYMMFDVSEYGAEALYSTEEIPVSRCKILVDKNLSDRESGTGKEETPAPNQSTANGNAQDMQAPHEPQPVAPCDPYAGQPYGTMPPPNQGFPAYSVPQMEYQNPYAGYQDSPQDAGGQYSFPWQPFDGPAQDASPLPDMYGNQPVAPDMYGVPYDPRPQEPVPNGTPDQKKTSAKQPAGAKKAVQVHRVHFDYGFQKTIVETDAGVIRYDPYRNQWEGDTLAPDQVDLDKLYKDVSKCVGQELRMYMGVANFSGMQR